jgi:DNA-binding HxlR family transcriptional regulator
METNYPLEPNIYSDNCPSRRVLDRLADKWTVLIVAKLSEGTQRFGELRRAIEGISPKVLTQTLRSLERDGIVSRRMYATIPPKVEYSLTPLGHTLVGLVAAIRDWAEQHIDQVETAQRQFDARSEEEALLEVS